MERSNLMKTYKQALDYIKKESKTKKKTTSTLEEIMNDLKKKRRDALGLFYESVLKPDHQLRECSHNQQCYYELIDWNLFVSVLQMVSKLMTTQYLLLVVFGKISKIKYYCSEAFDYMARVSIYRT